MMLFFFLRRLLKLFFVRLRWKHFHACSKSKYTCRRKKNCNVIMLYCAWSIFWNRSFNFACQVYYVTFVYFLSMHAHISIEKWRSEYVYLKFIIPRNYEMWIHNLASNFCARRCFWRLIVIISLTKDLEEFVWFNWRDQHVFLLLNADRQVTDRIHVSFLRIEANNSSQKTSSQDLITISQSKIAPSTN